MWKDLLRVEIFRFTTTQQDRDIEAVYKGLQGEKCEHGRRIVVDFVLLCGFAMHLLMGPLLDLGSLDDR